MLLANMAVAHKLNRAYPDLAVLRRHPPPQTRMLDELVGLFKMPFSLFLKSCHRNALLYLYLYLLY